MNTFNTILTDLVVNMQNFELAFTVLIFFIAFFESLAIIGYVMPGTILLYAGSAIALKEDLVPHFIIASTVAGLIADAISFYLGVKGNSWVTKHTHGHEHFLQKTNQFFEKYGAPTIIIGKISGTLRPLTAFTAGTLHMSAKKYFPIALAANIITSALYIIIITNFKKYIWPITGSLLILGPFLLFAISAFYVLRQNSRPSSHPDISHAQGLEGEKKK